MPEWGFLVFSIFLLFFSEFSSPGRVWTEIGAKFFFLSFSNKLLPFWLKIIPERYFLIFLIFIFNFFRNFLALAKYERNSGLKFFSLFLGQSHPVLPKYNTRNRFLIFSIFLLFFSEFSSPSWGWTEFQTKNFFSLSQPISYCFG